MNERKRPLPADDGPVPEPSPAASPEDAPEPDFFADQEHDGWSPIVRRSSTPPEPTAD
ncbi:MAG TPA: hypothetical protein VIL20_28400 [Sandaracinaceae bacterium]